MTEAEPKDGQVNRAVVERLAESWPKRATVRGADFEAGLAQPYDPGVPDYPVALLPFADHPLFLLATPAQRQEVLTWAWLVYNERVIAAEEHVANPAMTLVTHGAFPGAEDILLRKAVQQALIDEHFHTYIHMLAVDRTCALRATGPPLRCPESVTYRRFARCQAAAPSPWERNLVALVWTVVSEVTINAYLCLLSKDTTIQPLHRIVTRLHDRDEAAHGRLMVEVAKSLYLHMSRQQRRTFAEALRPALEAFVAHDFSAWRAILHRVGIEGAEEIVDDCEHDTGTGALVRDFSGMRRLLGELSLGEQLDLELPTNPALAGHAV